MVVSELTAQSHLGTGCSLQEVPGSFAEGCWEVVRVGGVSGGRWGFGPEYCSQQVLASPWTNLCGGEFHPAGFCIVIWSLSLAGREVLATPVPLAPVGFPFYSLFCGDQPGCAYP